MLGELLETLRNWGRHRKEGKETAVKIEVAIRPETSPRRGQRRGI